MPLWFTRDAVRRVDELCVERYGLPGIVLMENAARALEEAAGARLSTGGRALILCGPGNNGGDGFALARRLHNRGCEVRLLSARPVDDASGDAGVNARICRAMGLPIETAAESEVELWPEAELLVDALLGTGLTDEPRGVVREILDAANDHPAPTLAVDIPTGLDCDRGEPLGAAIRAEATVTFVGMKRGFANPRSERFTGTVSVGDIGAPIELVRELGSTRPDGSEAG